jgi:hypothetical protein
VGGDEPGARARERRGRQDRQLHGQAGALRRPRLERLRGPLAHELAYAYVRRVSRDRAPGWLHEGLAQWWEGKRMPPGELRAALAGRTLRTLSEMEGSLS